MRIRLGDLFEVPLGNGTKAVFQYVANDAAQLGADVIQVSKRRWATETDVLTLIKDLREDFQIDFFLHTTIKLGLRDGSWTKIGALNCSDEYKTVWFKDCADYGFGTSVTVSNRWRVFRVNQPVLHGGPFPTSELPMAHLQDELGYMFPTASVRHRIEFGVYMGFHPQPTWGTDPKLNNWI